MNARVVVMWFALILGGVQLPVHGQAHELEYDLEGAGVLCIALAVFAEAPDSSWLSQALVAQVIVNRQRGRNDACDVVADRRQFARLAAWAYPRDPERDNAFRWAAALDTARQVSAGEFPLPPRCMHVTGFVRAGTAPRDHVACSVDSFDFTAAPQPAAAVATGLLP